MKFRNNRLDTAPVDTTKRHRETETASVGNMSFPQENGQVSPIASKRSGIDTETDIEQRLDELDVDSKKFTRT